MDGPPDGRLHGLYFLKKFGKKRTKNFENFCQKWPYFLDNLSRGDAWRGAHPGTFVKCEGCVSFVPIGRPIWGPPHGRPWMGKKVTKFCEILTKMALFLGQIELWSHPKGGQSRALRKMWRLCFLSTCWVTHSEPASRRALEGPPDGRLRGLYFLKKFSKKMTRV